MKRRNVSIIKIYKTYTVIYKYHLSYVNISRVHSCIILQLIYSIYAQVQTLSLVIVTFTYLLVGAAVFDALEGTNNENALEGLLKVRYCFPLNKFSDQQHHPPLYFTKKTYRKPLWRFSESAGSYPTVYYLYGAFLKILILA